MVAAEKREGGRDHKFGNSLPLRHQTFTFRRSQIFSTFQLKLQSIFIRAPFQGSRGGRGAKSDFFAYEHLEELVKVTMILLISVMSRFMRS